MQILLRVVELLHGAARMSPDRPPRLPAFGYAGMHRYFLTICAADREPLFRSRSIVESVLDQLVLCVDRMDFTLLVYCFMPDHLHALLEARTDGASLLECVRWFKQVTAFQHRRSTGRSLWQSGYFERVVRYDEQSAAVARYILENPVRAGLTRTFQDYPFSGSQCLSNEQLTELWKGPQRRRV